jgi:hypothetical protein
VKAAAVVALSALLLATTAGAAPTWRAALQLSPSQRALGPELAMNAAGDSIVVWNREEGAVCPTEPASLSCIHIVETTSRDRAASAWQPPIEVGRPGIGNRPQVAINDAGSAAILWVHDIGEPRVVQAKIRSGLSGAWPNANDLSGMPLEVRSHAIALDAAGNAVAVWAQRDAATFYVVGDFRVAARGYWEAPVALSSVTGHTSAGPTLAFTWNSFALAAWIENGQLRVASGQATTGVWDAAVTLASGVGDGTDVDVALNLAGDAAVAWSSPAGVHAATRAPGAGWTAPVRLGAGTDVDVDLDRAGSALTIWTGASGVLQSARHRRGAATWSRPFVVARDAVAPRLAVNEDGNAVAVWIRRATNIAVAALRPASLGTWVRHAALSGSGASAPRVAISARGQAVAVWNRIVPLRILVESRALAGAGPVLAQLKVPNNTVVGRTTRFSVLAGAWASPLVGVPRWRFGDGMTATGPAVSHAYASAGNYRVTVTARDANGGVSTLSRSISVSG